MKTIDTQLNYSKINPRISNYKIRHTKAKKILAVLKDCLKKDFLRKAVCLDVGCSIGATGEIIGPNVKKFVGIDIDRKAIKIARKDNRFKNVKFEIADAMNLKFPNSFFDVIICNQVYEHVPNKKKLFSEIHRLLKDFGICYLGASNKLVLIEPHSGLPFLSLLPKRLANSYLKFFKRGSSYYENLCSYRELKHLLRNFDIEDYTIKIIKRPRKFLAQDTIKKYSLIGKLPKSILNWLSCFFPGWIWILRKK